MRRSIAIFLQGLRLGLGVLAFLYATPARAQWPQGALVPDFTVGYHSFSDFYLAHGPDPTKTWCVTTARAGLGSYRKAFGFTTSGTATFEAFPSQASMYATPAAPAQNYDQAFGGRAWAPDAGGGAFYFYPVPISIRASGLWVLRFGADGAINWNATRVDSNHTRPGTRSVLATLTTPDSGAWCVWQDVQTKGTRLVRIDRNAAFVPPYKLGGKLVPGLGLTWAFTGPALAPDGNGGLLIAASDPYVRVQRIGSDTTIASGWPATGLALSDTITSTVELGPTGLVRADDAAFFVLYQQSVGATYQLLLNRFLLSGSRDPRWPAAGIVVPSGNPILQSLQGTPDHQGGVSLTWLEDSLLYAMHLRADGTPATGYAAGPRVLANPPRPYTVYPTFDEPFAAVGVCEGHEDGLFVSFVDANHVVHARWYDGNGDPDPSPALYEVVSPSADVPLQIGYTWFFAHAAQSDGAGGAYVALERWLNGDPAQVNRQTFAHITQTSVLASPPPPAPSHLVLRAGPNPMRGDAILRLALPRAARAKFALYDLSGRLRFTRDFSGAGEHTIALREAGELEPGVYLARVTQGSESASARIVCIR